MLIEYISVPNFVGTPGRRWYSSGFFTNTNPRPGYQLVNYRLQFSQTTLKLTGSIESHAALLSGDGGPENRVSLSKLTDTKGTTW